MNNFLINTGIGGLGGMKPIYGIIVAEGKANQGKDVKVKCYSSFILYVCVCLCVLYHCK